MASKIFTKVTLEYFAFCKPLDLLDHKMKMVPLLTTDPWSFSGAEGDPGDLPQPIFR
jgi:hypothetical protein